ncbi:alkaline phosphatase-like protein [Aspergillus caelatus]|uniref:GPI ethanolamine phosphate transferase 2 n=1 Tax=Aspergillus caelatus TaxID=61420 RepID=A0A5N6ZKL5_9EURO|nr:alkaline phosphatase-like protein [Aspergillus caelatus]KAE8358167.1 alkaline phosphatase-like protein [Aspergillus caelatus]
MGWHFRTALLLLANAFILVSAIVFAAGLFRPIPPSSSSAALVDDGPISEVAPFQKVVFLIVDALRSDFVYGLDSNFEFTQNLIRLGAAMPFTVKTSSPSLTRSCVMAMTIGSASSFLDVFNNADDGPGRPDKRDTWLARLKAAGKGKLLFYGDDTWAQLFPDLWDRGHFHSALFVPDLHSIDINITTSALDELHRDDWSAMVLHLPGIDHIGHMGGAGSHLMASKQKQMDNIVQKIYTRLEQEVHLSSTLLIVGGDHGMDQLGGHGGGSDPEISAAMMFISPHLQSINQGYESPTTPSGGMFDYYTSIKQVDLVPTIAGLLGIPIPNDSIGMFIPGLLPIWKNMVDRVQLIIGNIKHLRALLCKNDCITNMSDMVGNRIQKVMETATIGIIRVSLLLCGIITAFIALLLSCYACDSFSWFNWNFFTFNLFYTVYGLSMMSQYIVESEHHFWFCSSTLWIGYLVFIAGRHSRTHSFSWVHGHKAKLGDVYDVRGFLSRHPCDLQALLAATFLATSVKFTMQLTKVLNSSSIEILCTALAHGAMTLAALTFELASAIRNAPDQMNCTPRWLQSFLERLEPPLVARFAFLCLLGGFIYLPLRLRAKKQVTMKKEILNVYLIIQSTPVNIPLFLVYRLQLESLLAIPTSLSAFQICISVVLFGQSAFFAIGNSNSIATLKYTDGFNGLNAHHWLLSPVHTFCSNYAGPIWWSCNGLRLLGTRMTTVKDHMGLRSAFVAYGLLCSMIACFLLRDGTFIWTVMAPKFTYTLLWTIPFHLLFNMGLPIVVWMAAS